MSSVVPFNFEGADVRVVTIDNEPWFIAKDVADALGYVNTSKAINTHCKAVGTCNTETGGQVYELIVKAALRNRNSQNVAREMKSQASGFWLCT